MKQLICDKCGKRTVEGEYWYYRDWKIVTVSIDSVHKIYLDFCPDCATKLKIQDRNITKDIATEILELITEHVKEEIGAVDQS
jgi:hypothetical protein